MAEAEILKTVRETGSVIAGEAILTVKRQEDEEDE